MPVCGGKSVPFTVSGLLNHGNEFQTRIILVCCSSKMDFIGGIPVIFKREIPKKKMFVMAYSASIF